MTADRRKSIEFVLLIATVLSSVLCGISAYFVFDKNIVFAVLGALLMFTAYLALQATVQGAPDPKPILAALALLGFTAVPFDTAGLTQDVTWNAWASDSVEKLGRDVEATGSIIDNVASGRDAIAANVMVWRQRANDELNGVGLSGNGSGKGGIWFAMTMVADQLGNADAGLTDFLSVAESERGAASQRVAELKNLLVDGRQNKNSEEVRTKFLKLRLSAESSLKSIVESGSITGLDAAIKALESPLAGAPAKDIEAAKNEIVAMRKLKQLVAVERTALREVQLAIESGLPSAITASREPNELERVLSYPQLCASFLLAAAALQLAQWMATWALVRRKPQDGPPESGVGSKNIRIVE